MKKIIAILCLLILSYSVMLSQNKEVDLKGKITLLDSDSSLTLAYANVRFTCLTCPKGTVVKAVIADFNGVVINPFVQKTLVNVMYFGYEYFQDTLISGESKIIYINQHSVELEQVIITAQFGPTVASKAVHKVKIIDKRTIESMGAVNLKDVLTNTANVSIAQDNILGSSTSIQGLSGQNVKILIDGVPVIGRLGGNVDLSQINLSGIDHIEIIEGPLSVEYGSNALAGTINLISKKKLQHSANLSVNSYYETVGQYNMDTELGFKWKTNTVKVSGGRNYFDGWKPEDEFIQFPKSLPADTNRVLSWKPKEQLFGKVTLRKKIKRNTVGLSSGYFREVLKNKGLPKTPYYESAFDDTYATRRWNNVLSFSRVPSKKSSLNLLFAYNYYKRFKHTSFVDLTTLEKSITTNLSDQDTSFFDLYMARGTYNKAIDSSKINFSVGYDINIEKAKGARIVKRIQQIGDFAMFGSLEYNPFKGFVIRPGLRYSYNTSYKAPLTPSVNLKYKIKYYTIRGSYSKGFRAPSIKDLYFDFVDVNHDIQGNPDLTAENSDNFSLSLQAVKKVKRNQYKANTSLFYNDISDLITMALKEGSNGSYSYFNLEQYKTMGMQIGGDLSIRYFKFSLVGTYTGRYNYLSDSIGVSVFNYSPQLRSNLNYKIKRNNLKFSLFYKYSGKVVGYYLDDEDEVKESLLGDFHTFDVTVSKGFWKNKVRWVIGCKNLFDVQSIQSTGDSGTHSDNSGSTPMSWGRSIFTSIKIDINKVYKKKE